MSDGVPVKWQVEYHPTSSQAAFEVTYEDHETKQVYLVESTQALEPPPFVPRLGDTVRTRLSGSDEKVCYKVMAVFYEPEARVVVSVFRLPPAGAVA